MLNHKTVLVTGGKGFIGSHLVERLITMECSVTVLDCELFGPSAYEFGAVDYISGSVQDINTILHNRCFDYIFHFGEYSRVEQSVADSRIALANTYSAFPNILEYWKSTNAKLIYSGSSTKFNKIDVDINSSPYVSAKSHNVGLLQDFARWYNLPYCIVYFYNVYGGRERDDESYGTVVGKFKKMVASGQVRLPVTSPGTQKRYFTHIEDTIDGIILAAGNGFGDGYGIGSEHSYSILELCQMFNCEVNFNPGNIANRSEGVLELDKMHELGWKAKFCLRQHIEEFMENLRRIK